MAELVPAWRAVTRIFVGHALAFTTGDIVSDDRVARDKYDELGLVERVMVPPGTQKAPGVDVLTAAELPAFRAELAATFATRADVAGLASVEAVESAVSGKMDSAAAHGTFSRLTDNMVNVKAAPFHAVGDGIADDTPAINAAWSVAAASTRTLYFPAGKYVYNGAGLDSATPAVIGDGPFQTRLILGSDSYLLAPTVRLNRLLLRGVQTFGGRGVIRHTYTANNVAGQYVVEDCSFDGYSGTAISSESVDMPYWKLRKLIFKGGNFTSTMGVALTGLTDAVTLDDCQFLANRVHVKTKRGGNSLHIRGCDFIRWGAAQGVPRVDVWVVPDPATTADNSGHGFTISESKFGNENLGPSDYRILYADEAAGGTGVHDRFPNLDADSTGYISGHSVSASLFSHTTAARRPLVYSTTPNLRGCRYSDLTLAGSLPSQVLEFRSPPGASRNNHDNIIGPISGKDIGTEMSAVFPPSNGAGVAVVVDPLGFFSTLPGQVAAHSAGDPSDYVNLLTAGIRSFPLLGGTSRVSVPDVHGGTDAAELTFTQSSFAEAALSLADLAPGLPAWIEFDVAAGSSGALGSVRAWVQYTSAGALHWRRVVTVGAGWRRHRFLWTPREKLAATKIYFDSAGAAGSVRIGRVRIYHASDPVASALALQGTPTTTTAPPSGTAAPLPAAPAGYLTAVLAGVARQIPYY